MGVEAIGVQESIGPAGLARLTSRTVRLCRPDDVADGDRSEDEHEPEADRRPAVACAPRAGRAGQVAQFSRRVGHD